MPDDAIILLAIGCRQASNHIELDEYEFIETSLERWRDRDYRRINREIAPRKAAGFID